MECLKEMECLKLAIFSMRTRFELVLVGEDGNHLRAAGEEALREIVELERLPSRFNLTAILVKLIASLLTNLSELMLALSNCCKGQRNYPAKQTALLT